MTIGITLGHILYVSSAGAILLIIILVTIVVAIIIFNPKTFKIISLQASLNNSVDTIKKDSIKVGDKGKSISRLAPMGKVSINNSIIEVQTNGEFIDEKTKVKVIKIINNKIIVKSLKK